MMGKRHTAFVFVALMLSSSLMGIAVPSNDGQTRSFEPNEILLEDAFVGFSIGDSQEVWNQTPFPSIAVPQGFDFLSVYDYSDVAVLINNNSEESRTIGWAFVTARNISSERVFIFENQSAPTKETINRDQFATYFAEPFTEMMQNRSNTTEINYLVTTKGIPLRVSGGNNKASFDQEIALVGGSFNSSVGEDGWVNHGYGPLAGGAMEAFSREEQGFYLVTRLTGYTVETALGLIEKANNSLGERGVFALDLATNRNGSGYKFWNDDLYTTNTTLNATMGLPTVFEETSTFLTNVSNVMGYASWGSNDGGWSNNKLPNGGFDSSSSTSSSGAQHWEATLPTLSAGDSFNWSRQNTVTHGGSSALEASVAAECAPEPGVGTPGIFAEFFDNAAVSFNAASMPSLIDRVPDHTRIESSFDFTSSYGAYTGLDNRFSEDWGARFSGLIDVPDAGNWTFFLTSDDGSEMWLDGASLVKNYGSHGMREVSTSVVLDAGLHDFRIEFFQGGGPHGLTLHWEGPNQTKDLIPASAFTVASDAVPSESHLQHHWSFEDSSGSTANDSAQGSANFTLHNMDSSNWRSCVDGGCLWYDGVDDYLEVDVDDWSGNFTVSQWVWANASTLPNYASVFAAGTQAGSNASFQHAIFSGEWRLHNNQTHAFGAINAQNWTHLVTVFDNGLARQYFDGVLVRSTQFPQGSVDQIDSYRLGVNRAGSTYFEGMIDEVMIWNTSLSDGEVTTLNRDIYLDCAAYSGNGQAAASVQQTFSLPTEYEDHAWLVSGHGMRTGDVYGTFELVVEGLDASGTVLSTNTSSAKEFGTAWASTTMRFEPHQSAVDLRITIPLNLVATSTDGSVYLDTIKMYPIRPSHEWMNGSIAETAVSTGARSFAPGTTYGQSLVADLLDDGASGLKGYVYEPYLTAVGLPSVLMTSYASGYNLAEAHAAANLQSSWMGVTVGDPKMAPYADVF
ncbi:MAG: TIGR03790 family protein, partial [Candidatus Poseidoniaceae archaeon]|nr:TIGR03790 family protein [Candidatus Poseidoniaceae archaeon]